MTDHRKGNKYLKLLRDTGQLTEHYKMYKAGKNWLFAGISLLTFGAGVAINQASVKADTVVADSSSESATTATTNAASSSSVVTLKAASDSSATSDTTTSASSAIDTESSAADTSSASDASSAATSTASSSAASTATSNSTNASSDTSDDASSSSATTDSSAASSTASDDTVKLAALQTELPAGTTISTGSDGTTIIELPITADIDQAKQIVEAADLQGAVTVTETDATTATSTGPLTYAGGTTSGTAFNKATSNIASAVTMGDFEWITAVGTGMLNGQAATLDEINAYFQTLYNANKGNYRLLQVMGTFTNNADAAQEATEANAAAYFYYYFLGSDDSYVSGLTDYLSNMTTAQLANFAQIAYDDNSADFL
ncbi:KxYKxGKxW signal peptide domain-containing protein, partial [Paucilactobacillus wasatchensis]|uniref:KxYKxGKxW signal peptide domain-containing protein n=1 Tax=Paucilactobacillus wasatchensis TaxID=1335616 RepID=UPI0005C4EB1C